MSSDFTRLSTVIRLRGGGEEGVGEDVTYDALDHVALQDAGPGARRSPGRYTLGELLRALGGLDLFPAEPVREVSRLYRRWAFESAALDLALRQAGRSLADALGREPRPVTFVVSLRLGEPPTIEPVAQAARALPDAALQARPDERLDRRADRRAGRDRRGRLGRLQGPLQGHGRSTSRPTPTSTGASIEAFPDAWIEDPALTEETEPVLRRTATASPGTRRSTRSPTSRRCPSRRGW